MPPFDNHVPAGRQAEGDAPTVAMSGDSEAWAQQQLSRSRRDRRSDGMVDESNKDDGLMAKCSVMGKRYNMGASRLRHLTEPYAETQMVSLVSTMQTPHLFNK
jgi:hypothetical protein